MRRWAEWLYRYRLVILVVILLVTGFFVWKLRDLDISTHFRDLYPRNHPYVKVFEKYPEFGSPFTVSLVVQVKKGDIYNFETLKKIQEATRLIDFIPGVNHNQVISIASHKVKKVEATVDGVQTTDLLGGSFLGCGRDGKAPREGSFRSRGDGDSGIGERGCSTGAGYFYRPDG